MTTEAKTKKNTDYSASAVNLTNHMEVFNAISRIKVMQSDIEMLDATLHAYPEYEQMVEKQQEMAVLRKEAEQLIEQYGSYQDTEKGWYGVKQRKVSVSYNAGIFEGKYPQFAPAVIIKAVDTTKLKGLIKGGLITEEELRQSWDGKGGASVVTETESFAYIIK